MTQGCKDVAASRTVDSRRIQCPTITSATILTLLKVKIFWHSNLPDYCDCISHELFDLITKHNKHRLEFQFESIGRFLQFKTSQSSTMTHSVPRLIDQSLFADKNYVDGQWVDSVSGKRFSVYGMQG